MISLEQRSLMELNLPMYALADQFLHPIECGDIKHPKDQYVLRMMVNSPWSNGLQIPLDLEWIRPAISVAMTQQSLLCASHKFCYVTVRCGEVKSTTDDEWHVDGFSMRKRHLPEQNYIWSDVYPTEVLSQNFEFPLDFDPFKHNIHKFFQDRADPCKTYSLIPKMLYQIDPYIVHRRPNVPFGTHRSFFRISFIPIEIEDDTCTPNPLLQNKKYSRKDIRENLSRYQ